MSEPNIIIEIPKGLINLEDKAACLIQEINRRLIDKLRIKNDQLYPSPLKLIFIPILVKGEYKIRLGVEGGEVTSGYEHQGEPILGDGPINCIKDLFQEFGPPFKFMFAVWPRVVNHDEEIDLEEKLTKLVAFWVSFEMQQTRKDNFFIGSFDTYKMLWTQRAA